jgi:sulfate transport system permease protein
VAAGTSVLSDPGGVLLDTSPGRRTRTRSWSRRGGLSLVTTYLGLVVLLPLAAVVYRSQEQGWGHFVHAIRAPESWAAVKLTLVAAAIVALVNLVMGTLIAWVLVRDSFPGKGVLDVVIDLPFALPTIVAGLVLLSLYGNNSALGVDLAYARSGVLLALLFVTLPFVVRTVQPVLLELDRDMEDAAASLGAGTLTTFRRIILPNLVPAMLAGTALAFARSISEFGSTVLISGNLPFKTEVASVAIYNQIQSDDTTNAAAVSTLLLAIAFAVLLVVDVGQRWAARRG